MFFFRIWLQSISLIHTRFCFRAALLLGRYLAVKGSRVFSRGYLLFHGLFYAVLAGAVYWCRFKGIAPVQDEFLVLLTALAGLGLVYAVKSCNKKYLTAAVAAMALFFNLALIPTVGSAVERPAFRQAAGTAAAKQVS